MVVMKPKVLWHKKEHFINTDLWEENLLDGVQMLPMLMAVDRLLSDSWYTTNQTAVDKTPGVSGH